MSKQRSFWDFGSTSARYWPRGTILWRSCRRRWISSGSSQSSRRLSDALAARLAAPALDAVLKFKMLVLQSLHGLSLYVTETMVHDRLTWLHFCGLEPNETVPDANTLWDFREPLI